MEALFPRSYNTRCDMCRQVAPVTLRHPTEGANYCENCAISNRIFAGLDPSKPGMFDPGTWCFLCQMELGSGYKAHLSSKRHNTALKKIRGSQHDCSEQYSVIFDDALQLPQLTTHVLDPSTLPPYESFPLPFLRDQARLLGSDGGGGAAYASLHTLEQAEAFFNTQPPPQHQHQPHQNVLNQSSAADEFDYQNDMDEYGAPPPTQQHLPPQQQLPPHLMMTMMMQQQQKQQHEQQQQEQQQLSLVHSMSLESVKIVTPRTFASEGGEALRQQLVRDLETNFIFGLDTETAPFPGVRHALGPGPQLLQLATTERCWIFTLFDVATPQEQAASLHKNFYSGSPDDTVRFLYQRSRHHPQQQQQNQVPQETVVRHHHHHHHNPHWQHQHHQQHEATATTISARPYQHNVAAAVTTPSSAARFPPPLSSDFLGFSYTQPARAASPSQASSKPLASGQAVAAASTGTMKLTKPKQQPQEQQSQQQQPIERAGEKRTLVQPATPISSHLAAVEKADKRDSRNIGSSKSVGPISGTSIRVGPEHKSRTVMLLPLAKDEETSKTKARPPSEAPTTMTAAKPSFSPAASASASASASSSGAIVLYRPPLCSALQVIIKPTEVRLSPARNMWHSVPPPPPPPPPTPPHASSQSLVKIFGQHLPDPYPELTSLLFSDSRKMLVGFGVSKDRESLASMFFPGGSRPHPTASPTSMHMQHQHPYSSNQRRGSGSYYHHQPLQWRAPTLDIGNIMLTAQRQGEYPFPGQQHRHQQQQQQFGFFSQSKPLLLSAMRGEAAPVGMRQAIARSGYHLVKPKGISCSNWAAPRLHRFQVLYAARDAFVSRMFFEFLQQKQHDHQQLKQSPRHHQQHQQHFYQAPPPPSMYTSSSPMPTPPSHSPGGRIY